MLTTIDMEKILSERKLLCAVTGTMQVDETQVRWITCDSREAALGTVFICKGAAFRKKYLDDAIRQGCIAYISEKPYETQHEIRGWIVKDIRKAMAVISAAFFEYEPDRPILIGITGTKGKTTTAWYLKAMLDRWQTRQGNPKTGLISTVANYDGARCEDAVMTTPEAPTLHEILAKTKANGLSHVTMEVSSQALKYRRVQELKFRVGIFLNISEDHISPQEHEDFEDYFSSKLSVFRQSEIACVNLDSAHADRILKAARKSGRTITFGQNPCADLCCQDIHMVNGKITFFVSCDCFRERFSLGMKGRFNIENAMAAIAAGYALGIPVLYMKEALASTYVPGRMETFFSEDKHVCGIVDFAHNRLSFERLFDAVYQEYPSYTKVITVFGCPGGKALNRRKELGTLAGLFSDLVYITSDSPGMEHQEKIAAEVRGYVERVGCACECVEEREEAIRKAVLMAYGMKEKALILVLGRGSEKYQKIGKQNCSYPADSDLLEEAMKIRGIPEK